jgi:ABC-2 type transport system ATP-binding protein
MWEIIKKLVADGTTLLLTTQYLEEADILADEIAVINHGKVIAQGTAAELKRSLGGDRLHLVFAEQKSVEKAFTLLKSFKPHLSEDAPELIIEIKKGFDELAEIIAILKKEGVSVAHTALHEPTLDDVFLSRKLPNKFT